MLLFNILAIYILYRLRRFGFIFAGEYVMTFNLISKLSGANPDCVLRLTVEMKILY